MNRKEFEQQIPHLRPLMLRVGRDFFGNRDDAEDVAQDSMERLWLYCERLDASRNLEALAVMVAKNICVEKYKRRQRLCQPSDERLCDDADQADAPLMAAETRERIATAIGTLSPREQQLIRRRYIDDHSADEIAIETGIPKPSVKSMISMAKAKLKKRLKQ